MNLIEFNLTKAENVSPTTTFRAENVPRKRIYPALLDALVEFTYHVTHGPATVVTEHLVSLIDPFLGYYFPTFVHSVPGGLPFLSLIESRCLTTCVFTLKSLELFIRTIYVAADASCNDYNWIE